MLEPNVDTESTTEPVRKLASVRRVAAIHPIPGADNIEAAVVDGWTVVVKKGEFKVNDLGCFLEIDAVPPDVEGFKWLWNKPGENNPRPRNFRIRTKKLRGCLSQGLLLPLEDLCGTAPGGLHLPLDGFMELTEGQDLTEALGVTKYEPPEDNSGPGFLRGRTGGEWPGFCPKTDEERIQNCKHLLDRLRGRPYVMTLKLDGTSATYGVAVSGRFHVCSRNLSIKAPEEGEPLGVYWAMAKKYDLERICRENRVAIQGEICGPGIQKNPLGLKEHDFFVFNVRGLGLSHAFPQGVPLSPAGVTRFCDEMKLKRVPIVESGKSFNYSMEDLLAKAEGKYEDTVNEREGLVVRLDEVNLTAPISFKVISNRFLLKEKD